MKKRINRNALTTSILLFVILIFNVQNLFSQTIDNNAYNKDDLLKLSKQKWQWMADRNIDSLDNLFDKQAVFIHMGGTMDKDQELNIIRSGDIQYKNTEIKETSVRFIENTAVVLDKIRLTAIVGGNEVVNPFMVTEVYVKVEDKWKLVSLSFTRFLEH